MAENQKGAAKASHEIKSRRVTPSRATKHRKVKNKNAPKSRHLGFKPSIEPPRF